MAWTCEKMVNTLFEYRAFPRIVMRSGISMSVQMSKQMGKYDEDGNLELVEVGFPSKHIPELTPYKYDSCDELYTQVPVEVIEAIIKRNGGVILSD